MLDTAARLRNVSTTYRAVTNEPTTLAAGCADSTILGRFVLPQGRIRPTPTRLLAVCVELGGVGFEPVPTLKISRVFWHTAQIAKFFTHY